VKKFRTDSWLTAVAVILTTAPALAEPVAIVTRVNGHVSARYRSAPAASLVGRGYFCNSGATLVTVGNSCIELRMVRSGSVVVIGPQTRVILGQKDHPRYYRSSTS
jgi:hypothetical protein